LHVALALLLLSPATLPEAVAQSKRRKYMKRTHATLALAALALLSLIFSRAMFAQQPPDNVGGDWTIYATNAGNGETEVKHVQIAQYGNRITGYFEGPNQSGPIQGEVNGHHIRFSTVTRNVLNFHGQIYGNNMSGECGIHGRHAEWQAVRTSDGSIVAQPVQPPAVSYSQPVLVPQETQTIPAYTPPAPAPAYTPTYAQQPAPAYSTQSYSAPAPAAPAPTPATGTTAPSPAPTPAPLSAEELDSLVAPIALYPDALVAQILAAATNPEQVAYADDWLAQNRNLTGAALAQAVDQQSWDPSVKALTQFSSVLDNLAHNLSWTSGLGQAFANQQSDVMAAVQTMRARAQAAGTLQSNSQITVTQPAQNTIVIQPANPQVIYVPQYNPTVVYGAPVVVPLYVAPPVPIASVGLYFGSGITIGAAFGGGGWGGGFGWGWHAWNVNWGGGWGGGGGSTIIFNHNTYINNHTWNNTHYNGYHPGTDTHYGPNGAYHPNGYFGPNGGWHPDDHGANRASQPNGGNNGNHGLIGGNGGVEHGAASGGAPAMNGGRGQYSSNGTYHPDPNYKPGEDTHYGPNGDYHPNGYYGPAGGFHPDKGTTPHDTPNGGANGNHGQIGGNGGVQRASTRAEQNRSRMSGDGGMNRMESNRGRESRAGRAPQQHAMHQHMPAEHHSGGGHRR
jgi:hypothetical protein